MSMYHYAIYEAESGRVVDAGRSTNPEVVTLNRERLLEGQCLYEGEIDPNTTYLPNGEPTPKRTTSEALAPQEVKALAGRLLSYTDWYVTRRADTGEEMPANIAAYRQAVRDASDAIEAMDPIPVDFRDQKYWPVAP